MSRFYFGKLFRVVPKRYLSGVLNRARYRAVLLVGDADQIVHQLACLVAFRRIRERQIKAHANLRQTRCAILADAVAFHMHIKRLRLRAPGRHHVHVHRGTPRNRSEQKLNRGEESLTTAKLNTGSR